MTLRKSMVLMVAMVLIVSLLAACQPAQTTTPKTTGAQQTTTPSTTAAPAVTRLPSGAKSITVNLGNEPPMLNTTLTTDSLSLTLIRHIYETLVSRDQHDNIIPGVAEKWTKSDDGLKYTFNLRKTAKWTNGDPVTANDFAFAFKTILDKDVAAEYAYFLYPIKNAIEFNKGDAKWEDVGVKVLDANTLEITLASPTGYFLDTLSFGVLAPVNEAFYKKVGGKDKYGLEVDSILSNGPYTLKTWNHKQDLTIVKSTTYWDKDSKDKYKIEEIKWLMIVDAQASFTAFLDGQLNMVGLANADYVQQAKDKGFTPATYGDGATFYLEFNLENEYLKNQKIRTAIAWAIDRGSFTSKILRNNSLPALSLTTPEIRNVDGTGSFQKDLGPLLKDNQSAEAKKLYDEGLKELGKTSIEMTMLSDEGERAIKYANALAEDLKKNLGIVLKIEAMPFKSRLERMTNKDFSVVFAGWGPDYNDPMTFLDIWESGSGNNHTFYADKDYDKLIADARKTVDDKARYKIYEQMEKKLMTDLPIVPIYFRIRDYVTDNNLKGVVRTAFQDINFAWAYVA